MKPQFAAEAPSNIALIKYMGKVKGVERNRPTNPSLSLTLNHLKSRVEISEHESQFDTWDTLSGEWIPSRLSDRGRKRYLAHFEFLKQKLGIQGHFLVCSANNFPSDCGIASSASSFAALTMAAYKLAQSQNSKLDLSIAKLAEFSRIGSGSSIRSFLGPWVLWDENGITTPEIPYRNLIHQVVVVDKEKKPIGSSDAHERVPTSLLFKNRPERAQARLSELLLSFANKDWAKAFEITWAEFWDMHALFATSNPSFQYMSKDSLAVLTEIHNYWREKQDGPLVTMDAGANVHFIYRDEQKAAADEIQSLFVNNFQVISGSVSGQWS